MDDHFYKDEFESFLQGQSDQHRMYPSDSIWRNINKKLHGDKKWPSLTIAAFTFIAAIIAISIYFTPGQNIFTIKLVPIEERHVSQPIKPLLTSLSRQNTPDRLPTWKSKTTDSTIISLITDELPLLASQTQTLANSKNIRESSPKFLGVINPTFSKESFKSVTSSIAIANKEGLHINRNPDFALTMPELPISVAPSLLTSEKNDYSLNYKNLDSEPLVAQTATKKSVSNNKWSYNVYITPSKSFRVLREDAVLHQKQAAYITGPFDINYTSRLNNIVRHIPGNGIEAGVAFGYALNKDLKINGGFQFNVRQYYIEAFVTNPEITTIALQGNSGLDSVNRTSIYKNNYGHSSVELINRYYQVSVPIGLDLNIININKDLAVHVAATVQPTYNLNNNSFLISTNYKNYAESGSMLNNWNVNTAIEAFLSINSGSVNWQVGPQFRYQQLPTFTKEYPIKEHLLDYGVKLAISRSIR